MIGTATGLLLLTALALLTVTRRELFQISSIYERHLKVEADKTQQLRESREWFQTTLKSLGDAVIAADARGRVTFINPVAEELTGWDRGTGATEAHARSAAASRRVLAGGTGRPSATRRARAAGGSTGQCGTAQPRRAAYPAEMTLRLLPTPTAWWWER